MRISLRLINHSHRIRLTNRQCKIIVFSPPQFCHSFEAMSMIFLAHVPIPFPVDWITRPVKLRAAHLNLICTYISYLSHYPHAHSHNIPKYFPKRFQMEVKNTMFLGILWRMFLLIVKRNLSKSKFWFLNEM